MRTPSRRRRLERLFAPSGGGGAPAGTSWGSTSLHPDRVISDNFDFADTATWLADMQARPEYYPSYETGSNRWSIDNAVTFGGHNSLNISNAGDSEFNMTMPEMQIAYLRVGYKLQAANAQTVPISIINAPSYEIEAAAFHIDATEQWRSLLGSLDLVAQPNTELDGSQLILVTKARRISATSVGMTFWVNGVQLAEEQIATVTAFTGWAFFGPYVNAGVLPAGGINLLFWEIVSGDGLVDHPYTGLGTYNALSLLPTETMVAPSGAYQFTLYEAGSSTTADSWECTGGTISGTGLFTAGVTEGPFTVTAHKGASSVNAGIEVSTFDPTTDIPSAHSWVEPDQEGAANDAAFASLTDQLGNNAGFVQAISDSRPLCKTNILAGKAVAEFDGVDDFMSNEEASPPWFARTTFVVGRILAGGAHAGAQVMFLHSGGELRIQDAFNQWYCPTVSGGSVLPGTITDWTLFAIRVNSSSSCEASANGSDWFEVGVRDHVWNYDFVNQGIHIGSHNGVDGAKCQIAGYLHATSALADDVVRKTRRWFNARLGGFY